MSSKRRSIPSSPAMEISALVNHDTEAAVLPRRSLSTSHTVPISPVAKISTPPQLVPSQLPRKRGRHDPKPIWAYREGEELPPELQEKEDQRLRAAASAIPPQPQSQPPAQPPAQPHHQPQTSNMAQRNGHVPSARNGSSHTVVVVELTGYERPVSDDAKVYDDVSRNVCDFIWSMAMNDELVRKAITDPSIHLEVEARWGHIVEKQNRTRLRGYHQSECVIKTDSVDVKFESTMTMEQHKRMNMYLNSQVRKSQMPENSRAPVKHQHTKEVDIFYELGPQQLSSLNPIIQELIQESGQRQRIRVTRNEKAGDFVRALIKHRVGNLEISSPLTEWDYRIGINLEIDFTGPLENLQPVIEPGKTAESMRRHKDRMSYSWMGAYQVDLTQVSQGQTKNHELELELNADVLLDNADKVRREEANSFEDLINGLMNNLRVLSREMTPPVSGA